ncbi:MAG TPA: hypothetical protein VHE61_12995 [Opitutaceae bacterium]|nr:hypothetical protein [Opitutaceae bacterium]
MKNIPVPTIPSRWPGRRIEAGTENNIQLAGRIKEYPRIKGRRPFPDSGFILLDSASAQARRKSPPIVISSPLVDEAGASGLSCGSPTVVPLQEIDERGCENAVENGGHDCRDDIPGKQQDETIFEDPKRRRDAIRTDLLLGTKYQRGQHNVPNHGVVGIGLRCATWWYPQ